MRVRTGDFVICLVIIATAVLIWAVGANTGEGEFAIVRVNGVAERMLDLRGGDCVRSISGLEICVEDGRVYVAHSECPDQVCVKTGDIYAPGQSIVCVPNRVSIEITGASRVDAIAGG